MLQLYDIHHTLCRGIKNVLGVNHIKVKALKDYLTDGCNLLAEHDIPLE